MKSTWLEQVMWFVVATLGVVGIILAVTGAKAADMPAAPEQKAQPALTCALSYNMTTGYLLGQAGAKVSNGLMAIPGVDCQHQSGFGGFAEGYFATDRGPFRYEVDVVGRYTKTFGPFDVGVRGGVYQVSPGGGDVTIVTARAWGNMTVPLSQSVKLRVGGAIDELHHMQLRKDTVGWSTNATLSWAATKQLTLSLGVERWDWLTKGFFQHGKPNHKIVPGFSYALNDTWSVDGDWRFQKGNQFDITSTRWKHAGRLGLTAKFGLF